MNESSKEILIKKNTVLEKLDYIKSIVLLGVKPSSEDMQTLKVNIVEKSSKNNLNKGIDQIKDRETIGESTMEHQQNVVNSIDLTGLIHSEKEKVRRVLREKACTISTDEQGIGEVTAYKMKINLKNEIPV